jgi:hypothetical protein
MHHMEAEDITIRVSPDAARAYRRASDEQRRKINLLLSMQISDVSRQADTLEDVCREASRVAAERGMTPQVLQAILDGR